MNPRITDQPTLHGRPLPKKTDRAVLVVMVDSAVIGSHELGDTTVRIGRSADAHVRLNDPLVSREHARIDKQNGTFVIRDLGSKNGTTLRGAPLVTAGKLTDGDEIRIGGASLRFYQTSSHPLEQIIEIRAKLAQEDLAFLQNVFTIVENRLHESGFGVSELAEAACLSERHFSRRINELTGETPFSILQKARMYRAEELLDQGMPVGNVAWECGFAENSTFTRAFKKHFGYPPVKRQEQR